MNNQVYNIKDLIELYLNNEIQYIAENFIEKLLNNVNFNRDYNDYKNDDFILSLYRLGVKTSDMYEKKLYYLILLELYNRKLINEMCVDMDYGYIEPVIKGDLFEKFVINTIEKYKEIKVLSKQYKNTDAILEYKNDKYILEIKVNPIETKEQVEKYKKVTNINNSISINGNEDININFSDVFINSKLLEISKMFVDSITIKSNIKNYTECIMNLIIGKGM